MAEKLVTRRRTCGRIPHRLRLMMAEGFAGKHSHHPNALDIVQKETGLVFAQVLEHAGVYKTQRRGKAAFLRFIQQV